MPFSFKTLDKNGNELFFMKSKSWRSTKITYTVHQDRRQVTTITSKVAAKLLKTDKVFDIQQNIEW